jgi:simple sugar transport system permease protein
LRCEACIRLAKRLIGGVGVVAGALFGGMIFGLTTILVNFKGSLSDASFIIVGGLLLFLFVVLQRFLVGSFGPQSAV